MSNQFSQLGKSRFTIGLASLGLILGISSCGQSPQVSNPIGNPVAVPQSAAQPKVVATTSVICDLVKQIAATKVDLTCLIAPGTDPHVYRSTPTDAKAIASANLILYAGFNFEPAAIKAIKNDQGRAIKVAVSELAVPQPLLMEKEDDHGNQNPESEPKPKAKEVADPHVWNDAKNGLQMAKIVEAELIKLSPPDKEVFAQNAQALTTKITVIDSWIKTQVATIPANQRKLVTTHDALGYFGKAYGLEIESVFEGVSAEEKPSAARIAQLVEDVRKAKVPTLFVEININPQLIKNISQETKVKISEQPLYGDGIGAAGSGADTYTDMLIANTKAVVQGLGGKFSPFAPKTSNLFSSTLAIATHQK